MGIISRQEWLARQQAREEMNNGSKVGYFGIKEDKGEAIVRFCYNSPEEFNYISVHKLNIDGKYRNYNCIRDQDCTCPLCQAGKKPSWRFYVQLIEYTKDENGNIVATPKIWDRPASFADKLTNNFEEYGGLKDFIFKIKRNGKPGDMKTEYDVFFPNQTIYNSELYTYTGNEFEGYKILGGPVMNKDFAELETIASKLKPDETTNNNVPTYGQTETPTRNDYENLPF